MGMFTEWRDDAYAALQAKYAKLEADYKRLLEGDDWVARCIRLENLHKDLVDEHRVTEEQLAEALAENAALVAEFQRLADEPPTLEEIAADLDKIEMLGKELAEARAEIKRLKATTIDASLLREKLAELAHNQWVGWMEYLFFKSKQVDGCVIVPAWANERWRRQVATRYADLSEEEKDSDRSEADKFLAVFNAQLAERDKLIEQMREALKALKQRHYVNDDDNWYSCPASGLCSNDHAGTDCNCGADYVNSIIQAALRTADGGEG